MLVDNSALTGGALLIFNTGIRLKFYNYKSKFIANVADEDGGALKFISLSHKTIFIVRNCSFNNNLVKSYLGKGGAISVEKEVYLC